MRFSAKTRYASRILLDLAMYDADGLHRASDISDRTGITVPFIEQIIKPLKHAGMVVSKRGASGGHQLNRPADKITLGDIVRVMEGSVDLAACLKAPELCPRADVCRTRSAWQRATDALVRELDNITLADLAKGRTECCPLDDDSFEGGFPV